MSLSYYSPPDRWHLLDTQTWDLLGAPSSCRRLESKPSQCSSASERAPTSSVKCERLGQDAGGLPVSPNIDKVELFFLHLKQIFWVLLAYLIVEEFPVLMTVIEAWLSSMSFT